MTERMEKALNEQINKELYSSYLYLSMAGYMESKSLKGFANWLQSQVQEEAFHAQKFYNFVFDRNGTVVLGKIDAPPREWSSPLQLFEEVLKHEQLVTASINDLVQIAREENDNATQVFLQWFINEQVEEEASVGDVVEQLRLVENAPGGLFVLDKEMAQRPLLFQMPAGE